MNMQYEEALLLQDRQIFFICFFLIRIADFGWSVSGVSQENVVSEKTRLRKVFCLCAGLTQSAENHA